MADSTRLIKADDRFVVDEDGTVIGVEPANGRGRQYLSGAALTAGQVLALQSAPSIGIVGDSLLYFGIRPGSLTSSTIPGLFAFNCSLACSQTGTGLLEFRAADRSMRFTAPSSTPGPWVPIVRAQRYRIDGGAADEWLEGTVFPDLLPAVDTSATLTLTPNPPFTDVNWRNVPEWVSIFSGQRTRFVNACAAGASLRHLVDLLADLRERAAAQSAQITEVWIQAGTNDVASGLDADASTMLASLGLAIDKALAHGWKPRVFSLPMRTLTASSAAQIAWRDFNRALPSFCAARGAMFNDIWAHTNDPASSTAATTGALVDGVHPSGWGGFCAGLSLWNQIGGSLASGQAQFTTSSINAYNAGTNPGGNLLAGTPVGSGGTAGTGGTATDVATGWDVRRNIGSITIVGTKAAALDGGVPWQRLTLGAAAAITDEAKYEFNLGVGVTTVAAGDEVEILMELNVPANAGIRRIGLWLTMVGAARNDSAIWDNFDVSATFPDLPAVAWPGTPVIRTPPIKIPVSLTSMRVRLFLQTAVSATPVVDVRRIEMRKIA